MVKGTFSSKYVIAIEHLLQYMPCPHICPTLYQFWDNVGLEFLACNKDKQKQTVVQRTERT